MQDPTRSDLRELIALNRQAAGLRLNARQVRARQNGQYLSSIKGRGMEFDESRPYQPGDDVRNIDWRVTARTGKTHTKMFREERERPVFISVDARSAMFFATQGRFKSVIASEFAALLAWTANQQSDRIGGEIYNETEHTEFRPQRGQKHLLRLFKHLCSIENNQAPQTVSMEDPLRRLNRIVHPGSMVCVISDFRGLDETASQQLSRLARHNEILLIHVHDRLESTLPARGRYRVSHAEQEYTLNADDAEFQQQYASLFTQRQLQLEQLSKLFRMNLLSCRTNESPVTILRQRFSNQASSARKSR